MGKYSMLVISALQELRPPKVQTVSEWADENRMLDSSSSAEPGRWHTDRAPYQREIMDAFTQTGVHEIVVMASSQVGKSEIELNMLGCAIDNDPGPILYMQPTEKVAMDYSKRRIAPMINACPRLRQKVAEAKGRDGDNTILMKTFPGGSLAIVGANSPSDLASKPIRYLFIDEPDRYPESAGTEGDPIKLAERRTETFRHNRKIVKVSTPTIKGKSTIEKAYKQGTQEEWHVECPHCRKYSFIRFSDIVFDKEKFKDEDGNTNYKVTRVAWKCARCGEETGEHMTKRQPGKWVIRNAEAIENGIRSFRLNAFMSPWSDWKDICLSFLNAKGDPQLLKVWHNTMLGESWEVQDKTEEPDKLYERREYYEAEVPDGALVLTMGVDTQDNRLEYEVVGWGRDEESWGIERGIIPGRADTPEVWEELDKLLDREWSRKNGIKMRILVTFVDSGGHFTDHVYRECARRNVRRVHAVKGEGGEKPYVRLMKKKEGNAQGVCYIIGVNSGKEAIMYAATVEAPGPRYMHYPNDYRRGYDLEYFRGLLSEKQVMHRRNGQNVMVWEQFYARNEPLDLRNYARAGFRRYSWNFDQLERVLRGEEITKAMTREQANRKKRRTMVSKGIQV